MRVKGPHNYMVTTRGSCVSDPKSCTYHIVLHRKLEVAPWVKDLHSRVLLHVAAFLSIYLESIPLESRTHMKVIQGMMRIIWMKNVDETC